MKTSFPIVPVALAAGVVAGMYLLSRRTTAASTAADNIMAGVRGGAPATRTTAPGGAGGPNGIDLSKLTYGRIFVVGSELNPNDPLAGHYTALNEKGVINSSRGVVNGMIYAKGLASGSQERDVPVSSITTILGA